MKKLIYILVAISTFIFGVTAFCLLPVVKPVSFLEITKNIKFYEGRKIRIKGYLEVWRLKSDGSLLYNVFDFKKSCWKECFEGASLHMPKGFEKNKNLMQTIENLADKSELIDNKNAFSGSYYVEIELVGEIEEINSCFGAPYLIKADEIEQISPIKFLSSAEFSEIIGRNNSSQ